MRAEIIDFRKFIRNEWRSTSVYKTVTPHANFAVIGSFSWDLTFMLIGIAIAIITAVVAERKLVERGNVTAAKYVHYGLKGVLIGTFAFYLIRLTVRAAGYFL